MEWWCVVIINMLRNTKNVLEPYVKNDGKDKTRTEWMSCKELLAVDKETHAYRMVCTTVYKNTFHKRNFTVLYEIKIRWMQIHNIMSKPFHQTNSAWKLVWAY